MEAPIVVIGDASGSMEVAIRTSTIIAGMLTVLTSAKLCFFNTENRDAPYLPKTIEEVRLALSQGCGNTMPYLSDLVPFHSEQVENFYLLVLGQV